MDVSVVAKGYLSLINANNRGVGIKQAADYLTPVVDISELLGLANRAQQQGGQAVGAGVITSNFLTIPAGEQWKVICGGASFLSGAASTWTTARLFVVPPGPSAGQQPVIISDPVTTVADSQGNAIIRPLPLLLESGTQFRIQGTSAGISNVWAFSIIYEALRG